MVIYTHASKFLSIYQQMYWVGSTVSCAKIKKLFLISVSMVSTGPPYQYFYWLFQRKLKITSPQESEISWKCIRWKNERLGDRLNFEIKNDRKHFFLGLIVLLVPHDIVRIQTQSEVVIAVLAINTAGTQRVTAFSTLLLPLSLVVCQQLHRYLPQCLHLHVKQGVNSQYNLGRGQEVNVDVV